MDLVSSRLNDNSLAINSIVSVLPSVEFSENKDILASINKIRGALKDINPDVIENSILKPIPIIGNMYKKFKYSNFADKFKNAKTVTDEIKTSLDTSFIKLYNESEMVAGYIKSLEDTINSKKDMLKSWETEMTEFEKEHKSDSGINKEISTNQLFVMKQDITDLQQMIAVEELALVTASTIIRNNNELMSSIRRANNVTATALGNALVLSQVLNQQENIYNQVNTLNKETESLIAYSSKQLKDNGTKIMKQASTAQLSIDTLKKSINDVIDAYNEIENFRSSAIGQLNNNIKQLDTLLHDPKLNQYVALSTDKNKMLEVNSDTKMIANI